LKEFEPRGSGAFQAYLRQALRNRIADRLRQVGRRPTNLRAVADPESPGGYRIEAAEFPGWETVPTW